MTVYSRMVLFIEKGPVAEAILDICPNLVGRENWFSIHSLIRSDCPCVPNSLVRNLFEGISVPVNAIARTGKAFGTLANAQLNALDCTPSVRHAKFGDRVGFIWFTRTNFRERRSLRNAIIFPTTLAQAAQSAGGRRHDSL